MCPKWVEYILLFLSLLRDSLLYIIMSTQIKDIKQSNLTPSGFFKLHWNGIAQQYNWNSRLKGRWMRRMGIFLVKIFSHIAFFSGSKYKRNERYEMDEKCKRMRKAKRIIKNVFRKSGDSHGFSLLTCWAFFCEF